MKSKAISAVCIIVSCIVMVGILAVDFIIANKKIINCENGVGIIEDYENRNPYTICGQWELYKDHLVISEGLDFSTLTPEYIDTVNNKLDLSNENLSYYTYRVIIKGVPLNSVLADEANTFITGYAIYVNGKLIRTDNKLVDQNGNKITFENQTSMYILDQDEVELVVECSNNASNYYAFVNEYQLQSVTKNFQILSFDSVYLTIALSCTILFLYFAVFSFSKKNLLRNILFMAINLAAVCTVLFNNAPLFSFVNLPAYTERLIRVSCYFVATAIFIILAQTDFCQKKFGVLEYIDLGLIVLSTAGAFLIPIKYITYLFGGIALIGISLLVYSLIVYLKKTEKDQAVKVCVSFFIILSIVCYVYEILLITPVFYHNHSLLPFLLFLACVMLNVLNSYLREKEVDNSSITKQLNDKIRDTEFTFLNSQIQSHFIYNTLNSIQSLCNTNPEKASDLVEVFSFYLRNRLEFNKMPNLINLEDEIEHIKTYINIEQTRFGDNIKCVYDLAVTDIKIPPLSIQPLVENAVKHGISKQVGGGIVIISTNKDQKNVYIRVKDNGLGFDVDKLKNSKRVGFNNIKDRLELYLGASIKLDSKVGVGTVVTITIPIKNLTYENTATSPL